MSECHQLSNGAYRFFPSLEVFPFSGGNGKIPKSKAIQIIDEFAIIDLYHFTITVFKYYS